MNHHKIYVIMGVSGSGKTTIGRLLAAKLNCPFYDGDDFHPAENVAKMAAGIPLNDNDRDPWLDRLHSLICQHLQAGETAVLACSALKKSYRDHLRKGCGEDVCFIHLNGRFDLIWQRMETRTDHYMKPEMLRSQFSALEPPTPTEALISN
ncbi:MAG: gluconokinase, partial [Candidatus Promineifilaceae bacterium]